MHTAAFGFYTMSTNTYIWVYAKSVEQCSNYVNLESEYDHTTIVSSGESSVSSDDSFCEESTGDLVSTQGHQDVNYLKVEPNTKEYHIAQSIPPQSSVQVSPRPLSVREVPSPAVQYPILMLSQI